MHQPHRGCVGLDANRFHEISYCIFSPSNDAIIRGAGRIMNHKAVSSGSTRHLYMSMHMPYRSSDSTYYRVPSIYSRQVATSTSADSPGGFHGMDVSIDKGLS